MLKNYLKMEIELSLTKDNLHNLRYIETWYKHEQELKEYIKGKLHRFKEILAPMIKDTKN
jgi:hypothetical protein